MEIFDKRYRPNSDDLFLIFIQFARFFKEFSDFETNQTPIFRHPPILGGKDVKEIGLYPEISKMKMYWGEFKINKIKKKAKRELIK